MNVDPAAIFTLVSQAGLAGLAVYLVVYGLPRWISEMKQERESDRQTIQNSQTELLTAYKSEARYEREQCQRQFEVSLTESRNASALLGKAIDTLGAQIMQHDERARIAIDAVDEIKRQLKSTQQP